MSANASKPSRRPPLIWLVPLSAVLAALALYGVNRAASAGTVLGAVESQGRQLGGLTEEEAIAVLTDLEASLATTPAAFRLDQETVELTPAEIGFELERESMAARAMEIGRTGSPATQFWWWLTHLFSPTELAVDANVDPGAVEAVLAAWDAEVIGDPPFPGGVGLNGITAEALYPRTGRQVDRALAPRLILQVTAEASRQVADLPIVQVDPSLSRSDIDRAVERAQLILAGPVTLTHAARGKQVTFTVEHLAAALRPHTGAEEITFSLDPAVVTEVLAPLRAELEDPPVNAELEVAGDVVNIVPGLSGTSLNPGQTARNLLLAASSAARTGTLPIEESDEPEVTTEELEALGIRHKVSQFTTYHPCCQNRVTNIHLIADKVQDTIVPAGETFSLNQSVGERTIEDGYLEDGTIIGGEITDTVGGGVSQFATTFYNAVFWGGYEDVVHKPHSFYFSRYPLGIEATISWPLPDLQFRNDSDHAVLIRTSYTTTSITVAFYGDNDGRILSGEQSDGRLRMSVVNEGGPQARVVKADISDPYAFREPPPPRYVADETLVPPAQEEDQAPAQGYSVRVTRTITQGSRVTIDEWTVVYSPRQQIIRIHPCQIEGSGVSCPTTTTMPGETTTTTVAP